jgi:hypothetical protein
MEQVLALQENALVTVLPLRTRPQAARFAPVVLALLVSYLPFLTMASVEKTLAARKRPMILTV